MKLFLSIRKLEAYTNWDAPWGLGHQTWLVGKFTFFHGNIKTKSSSNQGFSTARFELVKASFIAYFQPAALALEGSAFGGLWGMEFDEFGMEFGMPPFLPRWWEAYRRCHGHKPICWLCHSVRRDMAGLCKAEHFHFCRGRKHLQLCDLHLCTPKRPDGCCACNFLMKRYCHEVLPNGMCQLRYLYSCIQFLMFVPLERWHPPISPTFLLCPTPSPHSMESLAENPPKPTPFFFYSAWKRGWLFNRYLSTILFSALSCHPKMAFSAGLALASAPQQNAKLATIALSLTAEHSHAQHFGVSCFYPTFRLRFQGNVYLAVDIWLNLFDVCKSPRWVELETWYGLKHVETRWSPVTLPSHFPTIFAVGTPWRVQIYTENLERWMVDSLGYPRCHLSYYSLRIAQILFTMVCSFWW